MINQIAPITQTQAKPLAINKSLIQARHIQDRLKKHLPAPGKPEQGIISSPITSGPYIVPVLRWIE
jgi:hypothetical protein